MLRLARTLVDRIARLLARPAPVVTGVVFTPQASRHEPGQWALVADRLANIAEPFETPVRSSDQYAAWALAVLLQAEPEISKRLYALCYATRLARHLDYSPAIQEIVGTLRADPRYAAMIASTHSGIRYGALRAIATRQPLAA